MSKYPRVSGTERRPKNTSAKCFFCKELATHKQTIEHSYLRGEDSVIWVCDADKGKLPQLTAEVLVMEEKARLFAEAAHASIDQRRKYTGEAYIAHPAAVVDLVRSVPHTEAMLCAAWLHDVVEDTPVPLEVIEREFGVEVAALVEMLTDVSLPFDGNRAERKAIDREHTAKASPQAKTIKLADLIDNTGSIVARDPEFAKVYLSEKALLLEVLRDGDVTLWARAAGMLTHNH